MSGRGVGSIVATGAEAAKRARLERIVSALRISVAELVDKSPDASAAENEPRGNDKFQYRHRHGSHLVRLPVKPVVLILCELLCLKDKQEPVKSVQYPLSEKPDPEQCKAKRESH